MTWSSKCYFAGYGWVSTQTDEAVRVLAARKLERRMGLLNGMSPSQFTQADLDRYDAALNQIQQAIQEATQSANGGIMYCQIAAVSAGTRVVRDLADESLNLLAVYTGPVGRAIDKEYSTVENAIQATDGSEIAFTRIDAAMSAMGLDASGNLAQGADAAHNGQFVDAAGKIFEAYGATGLPGHELVGLEGATIAANAEVAKGFDQLAESQQQTSYLRGGAGAALQRIVDRYNQLQDKRNFVAQQLELQNQLTSNSSIDPKPEFHSHSDHGYSKGGSNVRSIHS